MEPGLPHLDDAVACDQGAADSLPAEEALLVSWAGWVGLRCRIPRLDRGDPARQSLMGAFVVIDLIEPVDLRQQFLEGRRNWSFGTAEGLLVKVTTKRTAVPDFET